MNDADQIAESNTGAPPVIAVLGAGLWLPGCPSLAAWHENARDAEDCPPTGSALGRINRRRAGLLGRALSDVTGETMAAANLDPAVVPVVVGSAIGEAANMIGILEDMWRRRVEVSPAAFAFSVHNAASGLMSIGYKNRGFATSIAADFDTPAVALMEAAGLIVERGTPVVVSCADESIPENFLEDGKPWDLMAAAIALAPADHKGAIAYLRIVMPGDSTPQNRVTPADVPDDIARNPQVGLLDLVNAVDTRASGTVALDRGRGHGYSALVYGEFPS